jgi:hypothetical protein
VVVVSAAAPNFHVYVAGSVWLLGEAVSVTAPSSQRDGLEAVTVGAAFTVTVAALALLTVQPAVLFTYKV